jgi:hypothetical protein
LRYLSDVCKALVQTVPLPAKTPEVEEIEVFLRAMVRAVDSSLLDEWEKMRSPAPVGALEPPGDAPPGEVDITKDERAFTVLLRSALYQLLRALARRDWAGAASLVSAGGNDAAWTAELFEQALKPFFEEHTAIRLDPTARAPANTRVTKSPAGDAWEVVQVLPDAEGDDDWAITCWIDLESSAATAKPVVVMRGVAG